MHVYASSAIFKYIDIASLRSVNFPTDPRWINWNYSSGRYPIMQSLIMIILNNISHDLIEIYIYAW